MVPRLYEEPLLQEALADAPLEASFQPASLLPKLQQPRQWPWKGLRALLAHSSTFPTIEA